MGRLRLRHSSSNEAKASDRQGVSPVILSDLVAHRLCGFLGKKMQVVSKGDR